MNRIISLVIVVIAILAAYDVLKKERDMTKRIIWIIIIIILPLLGALVWFVVSRRK